MDSHGSIHNKKFSCRRTPKVHYQCRQKELNQDFALELAVQEYLF